MKVKTERKVEEMDKYEIFIECTRCHHREIFPVETSLKTFSATLVLVEKIVTVGKLNSLLEGQRRKFCDCPSETALKYTVPGWFQKVLDNTKREFEKYKKEHPL